MEDKTMISTTSQLSSDREMSPEVLLEAEGGGAEANHDGAVAVGPGGGIGSSDSVSVEITVKRKRGRPRKFDIDQKPVRLASRPPGFSSSLSVTYQKRGRGRPRGSGRLQLLASLGGFLAETAGGNIIPHVVTVNEGEDIVNKILSFAQRSSRAICILTATGAVSSVIIRQPGSSGGILRYEGRFEILSLTGSFTFVETSGVHRKNGMLSVSLSKPDGRVFGGGVVGSLIASGPIQMVVASFKQNIKKELKLRRPAESSTAACTDQLGNSETVRFSSQIGAITDGTGEENCTTPTSAIMEATNGLVTLNQDIKSDAQNVFQQPQPMISG